MRDLSRPMVAVIMYCLIFMLKQHRNFLVGSMVKDAEEALDRLQGVKIQK